MFFFFVFLPQAAAVFYTMRREMNLLIRSSKYFVMRHNQRTGVIFSQEVAERSVCLQSCTDEELEQDFDEDVVAGSALQHFQRKVTGLLVKKLPQ